MKLLPLFLTVTAAVLAGVAGLVLSIGIGGPSAFRGTPIGRWLGERVAPVRAPLGVTPASEGETIGTLALTDLDGHPQPLPSPQGRRVLVNVWATWCAPCRDEMPVLAAFAKAQPADGVVVVGLSEDPAMPVGAFLRQTPVNYPILIDDAVGRAGLRLGNRLGVLPFTALVDADGHLVRRQYGPFANAEALKQWASAP
jgi:thiol-disulfide isomerase/thioredoxin